MKFTDRWSCAAEAFEERKEEYDNTIKQNPDVQAQYRRVDEYLGSIRNALNKGGASDEAIETIDKLLDKLEESNYIIVSKVIENLAEETHIEIYIAYQVGLLYSKLLDEKKASRSKQKDMDQD